MSTCEVKDSISSKKKEVFLSRPRTPPRPSTFVKRSGGAVDPKKAPNVNNLRTISDYLNVAKDYKHKDREVTEEDTYRVTSLPKTESEALDILAHMSSVEKHFTISRRSLPTAAAPGGVIDETAVDEGPARIRAAMMRAKLQAQNEAAQAKAASSGGRKAKKAKTSSSTSSKHDAYQPTEEEENSTLRLEDELWYSRDYMTQLAKPLFDIVTELVNDLGPMTALTALNNAVGEETFKVASACEKLYSEGVYQASGGDPPNPSKMNIPKAVYYMERAVSLGANSCLWFIASLYWHPLPSQLPSYTKAAQYLLEAERRGVPSSALGLLLGHCYAEGIGVERDFHKAVYLYQVGSFDDASDLIYLARLYSEGHPPTIPPDPVKSIITLMTALKYGATEEDFLLSNYMDMARAYKYGIFVEENWQKAMDYYHKGANMLIRKPPPTWMNMERTAATFYKELKEHEKAMKSRYRPNPEELHRTKLKMLISSSQHHSPNGDPVPQSLVNAQIGNYYMFGRGCTTDTKLAYDYLVKALPNIDALNTIVRAYGSKKITLDNPKVLFDHLELTLKHVNDYQNEKPQKITLYGIAVALYSSPRFNIPECTDSKNETKKELLSDRIVKKGAKVKMKVVRYNIDQEYGEDEWKELVNSTDDDDDDDDDNNSGGDEDSESKGGINDALAVKYCDSAISLGDLESWYKKGLLYFRSPDPKVRSRYKAIQSLLTAERLGLKLPQMYLALGQGYLDGGKDGDYYLHYASEEEKKGPLVPRDPVKAQRYFKLALSTGDPSIRGPAWRSLGLAYFSRYARRDDENPVEAMKCFTNALAIQQDIEIFSEMGYMYTYGLGVERDLNRAFDYLLLSARCGNESSKELLKMAQDIGSLLPPTFGKSSEITETIHGICLYAAHISFMAEKASMNEEDKQKAIEYKSALAKRIKS